MRYSRKQRHLAATGTETPDPKVIKTRDIIAPLASVQHMCYIHLHLGDPPRSKMDIPSIFYPITNNQRFMTVDFLMHPLNSHKEGSINEKQSQLHTGGYPR